MEKTVFKLLVSTGLCLLAGFCQAQSISVGSPADQYLRFLQLVDDSSSGSSLVSRPLGMSNNFAEKDSALLPLLRTGVHYQKNKNIYVGLLPLALDQQVVTHHPLWQNDGAMIPAKGYQFQLSGGIYGRVGPLSFQAAPEFVYAANTTYEHTPLYGADAKKNFRKVYPGQSYVRLHAGPIAVSLSSENLWWGPGVYQSLIMSSQAPGFPHLKLHTTRPLKTPIGNFEWTLLAARLSSDEDLPYDNDFIRYNALGSKAANRHLSAYVVSYTPRFLQGLSLGLARALQQYEADVKAPDVSVVKKYLPIILKPAQKKNAQDDDTLSTDQVASAFLRWVFKKSHAELYAEYGFNDYKKNIRDYVMNLPHSAAYLVGFRKAFPIRQHGFIEAGIEIVQLSQSPDALVRNAGNWYIHGGIREGYTHQNQVMGAAFATNTQTLQIALRNGLQRTAFTLQHFQRDPNRDAPRWNDWGIGFSHSQFFKGFYLDGQLQAIAAQHYAWQQNASPVQVMAKAGVRYYFHD